jgi:hypothetical protein
VERKRAKGKWKSVLPAQRGERAPIRGAFIGYSRRCWHCMWLFPVSVSLSMSFRLIFLLCTALALTSPSSAGVENRVRELQEAGAILPYETIRARVMQQVRGDYVGVEFDAATLTYRFRFLVDGNVINVDVDARTGQRRRGRNF